MRFAKENGLGKLNNEGIRCPLKLERKFDMKKCRKIVCQLKGSFYVHDFFDVQTLKELMEEYNIKRSEIVCWWKEY